MEILFDEIPSLDLADFTAGNPTQKAAFVQKLGEAYQNIGFVAIKNHGLSQNLQDRLYGSIKDFFNLPDAVKANYEKPEIGFQRGYTGKGKEHAKGRNTGDLKEFYHVGQELSRIPDTDPIKSEYPPNIWPSELPEFQNDANEAFRTLESAGKSMLRAIALSLDL
ncbi:MAG: 2-oxoglutarate and iron-dependent oxygenase domain-containing protein, partial [Algoriphagus sp.]